MRKIIFLKFLLYSSLIFSNELTIIVDADFSHHYESSQSIFRGLEQALKTVNNEINNFKIKIVKADHKGNSKRSKRNIENFLKSNNSLLMMSGIHSPPLLAHKDFINKNKVPFLIPWAAAGPITRSDTAENWIYRLSIDDTKAGGFLSDYAIKKRKIKRPCLLLEDTGWGKSNYRNMLKGFSKNKIDIVHTSWFKWGIRENESKKIAKALAAKKCDVIMFVGNANEGKVLINSIATTEKPIPVISHWGITGGSFHKNVSFLNREKVNLRFIQTKFNFNTSKKSELSEIVEKRIISSYPDILKIEDLNASTGFVHSYDLGLMIIDSLRRVKNISTIEDIRKNFKDNLESINIVKGLLKEYKKPFRKYSSKDIDSHEALNVNDFAIGYYCEKGIIYNEK